MRYVELRRHTDNEGDRLAPQRAAEAEMIGRDRLHPPYAAFVLLPSRYLNIQRLNYLWTIRHSSARIAGNMIT